MDQQKDAQRQCRTNAAPQGGGLTIKTFTVNFIEENCYVVWDATREAVIIDCGANDPSEQAAIAGYIADNHLTVKHLLNTHGHFDHIFGNAFVKSTYGLSTELHADDLHTYSHAVEQMQKFLHCKFSFEAPPVGRTLAEGDTIRFGTSELTVIHTPGHTPGGVCFYCAKEGVLFSGDSLFLRSIGRTDLPGGSLESLVTSLQQKILTLPANVRVYPGHGPSTDIATERIENPCL